MSAAQTIRNNATLERVRFADGRIVETWGVVDLLSQLRQLGAIPV